jgi:hypothetical protein
MRLKKKNISSVSVQFEKHEPERRRGSGSHLFCNGGCCCCCCCCLHSMGGLIGAAAAATKGKSRSEDSVIVCYWICLVFLIGLTFIFSVAAKGFGIFVALMALPLVQFVASILTWICIGIGSTNSPDRRASMKMLGKITLWSFLGTLAGGVVVVLCFVF